MVAENIENFLNAFRESLDDEKFVKLTLGNYKGDDPQLQKVFVRLLSTKKGIRLFFLYRYNTRDTAKNYTPEKGMKIIRSALGNDFFSGHLFTLEKDFHLEIGKHGRSRLNTAKPTFKSKPDIRHNREKRYPVSQGSFYLKALGITTEDGRIRAKQHGKWKQINKFVETIGSLYENSDLKHKKSLKVVDMGSGKGYLTFAAYDYFANSIGIDVEVTGIDTKEQLVELCGSIATSCGFDGLNFEHRSIDSYECEDVDILIALHACDTATDEAIYKGIKARSELIIAAPCCHREIRGQIKAPEMLKEVFRHGIFRERESESITDAIRSLLLESEGYSTRVFEFVSPDHTPKNNMIVGTLKKDVVAKELFDMQIRRIKEFYGIKTQRLEKLLGS